MWNSVKKFFKSSETIFLARVTMLAGAILEVVITLEPSLFAGIFGRWFPLFLICQGVLTEYMRKRRAEDMK